MVYGINAKNANQAKEANQAGEVAGSRKNTFM